MSATTRIGDVLLEAYPFEKLRVSLKKASDEVEKAAADRSNVDDNTFGELIERQDSAVAQLAARAPASTDEAIFLLRILRDRMDADFDSSVIEASNRDIVRGVTAYLSEANPVAVPSLHAADLVKTDWRKLLDEYRRLARAENSVAETYPDPNKPPLSTVMEECWANSYSRAGLALRSVLDFLAEQTGGDPFMVHNREGEPVRFSKEEIAEAAELYSKEKTHWAAK